MNLHAQEFTWIVAWETANKTALFQMSEVHLTRKCIQMVEKEIW
jgi:hypothetical protein